MLRSLTLTIRDLTAVAHITAPNASVRSSSSSSSSSTALDSSRDTRFEIHMAAFDLRPWRGADQPHACDSLPLPACVRCRHLHEVPTRTVSSDSDDEEHQQPSPECSGTPDEIAVSFPAPPAPTPRSPLPPLYWRRVRVFALRATFLHSRDEFVVIQDASLAATTTCATAARMDLSSCGGCSVSSGVDTDTPLSAALLSPLDVDALLSFADDNPGTMPLDFSDVCVHVCSLHRPRHPASRAESTQLPLSLRHAIISLNASPTSNIDSERVFDELDAASANAMCNIQSAALRTLTAPPREIVLTVRDVDLVALTRLLAYSLHTVPLPSAAAATAACANIPPPHVPTTSPLHRSRRDSEYDLAAEASRAGRAAAAENDDTNECTRRRMARALFSRSHVTFLHLYNLNVQQ